MSCPYTLPFALSPSRCAHSPFALSLSKCDPTTGRQSLCIHTKPVAVRTHSPFALSLSKCERAWAGLQVLFNFLSHRAVHFRRAGQSLDRRLPDSVHAPKVLQQCHFPLRADAGHLVEQ